MYPDEEKPQADDVDEEIAAIKRRLSALEFQSDETRRRLARLERKAAEMKRWMWYTIAGGVIAVAAVLFVA